MQHIYNSLKDKVILITGASSGIGRACAEAFAPLGPSLALTGRNAEALQQTKENCCDAGLAADKIFTITGDLMKDDDSKAIVDNVIEHFGRLDILVNNAGIGVKGSTESISMEEYDLQMRINVRSPFLMTKLCLPYLKNSKGCIINVSSIGGMRGFPGKVAYSMSKAAIDQLTRTLALEVAAEGVRVNAVNPGSVVTEIYRRTGMDEQTYKKFIEHSKTLHPIGRVAEPHEIASAVVFLASEESSFITGVTLPIDGGRSLVCPR